MLAKTTQDIIVELGEEGEKSENEGGEGEGEGGEELGEEALIVPEDASAVMDVGEPDAELTLESDPDAAPVLGSPPRSLCTSLRAASAALGSADWPRRRPRHSHEQDVQPKPHFRAT